MNNSTFSRRRFLLGAGAAGINSALAFETMRQSGLLPGVDETADARKKTYEREQLKLHTLEGRITDASGTPLTEPSEEGSPAPVLDPAFSSICGMRSKKFGTNGLRQVCADELFYAETAHGRGATVTTSLNAALQKKAYELTAGFRGSVALLDIDTGAVVALADRPSASSEFDPNNVNAETMERWNNEADFWYPPSTTCCLQPGSVQKIVDAAAIFSSGVSQNYIDTGMAATGIKNAGGAVYGGPLNVTDMLRLSINTYAADVTCRVPGEVFSRILDGFFYNHIIELDWGRTLNPIVNFDPDDLASFSWAQICIGHGPIQTAPLHLALIIGCCLHPEGRMIRPFMVRQITRESSFIAQHEDGGNILSTPLPDPAVREQLVDALAVTAEGYHLSVPGGIVLAKTGTATIKNSDRANVFLAFAIQTSRGRRFAGVLSRENVTGSSAQLKPVCQEFINYILAEEENIG